jgi:polysaccharide deacetylase 2 family uncharacterized protein YibQ
LDDLNTPLAAPKAKRWLRSPISAPHLLVGVLGLFLTMFAVWVVTFEDPLGGEPVATALIPPPAVTAKTAKAGKGGRDGESRYDGPARAADANAAAAGGKTVTIIDGSSGKRQQVAIPDEPEQGAEAASIEDRLLERTRHGRIPKLAMGGVRAVDVFASPAAKAQAASKEPRVAIIIGGLGISASSTADALSRLPPEVSVAFVPYGANLTDLAAGARARGHEVLLQAPMESFDYPENDPGPQTLLTTLPSEQNLDRLHWQMARLQGYVGVMNFMGARFVTSEKALAPVLDDVAKRGLLYVDDGSSARSVASDLAAASNVPFVKASQVLDSVPTPADIDRALSRLEAVARKDGIAVGVANALPVSIDRIVRWAKGAAERGVKLVPVTVAAAKARSS